MGLDPARQLPLMMVATEFAVQSKFASDRRSPRRWVLSHILRHKALLLLMFVGAFGNASLAAVIPVAIGRAFDAALAAPADLGVIGRMALLIVASQTIRAGLQLGRNFSSEVIGQRLERDTRQELYVSLLGKSMAFHDMQPVGDTMARATNDVREIARLLNPGFNLVVGSANFILLPLFVAPTYASQLVLAPAFFLVTYSLALARYLRVLSPVADRVRMAFGAMNSRLAEAIDGIETVKGAAQEKQENERFDANAGEYRDAAVVRGRIEARFLPLLLLGITYGIGFAHALALFDAGRLAVGDVIAYMGLLGLFSFPTFVSLNAYSQVSLGMAGARRILDLIQAETLLDENPSGHEAVMMGAIRFGDVSFSYVEGVQVLKQISFEVSPGQTVAIVGQTASGKSSIAKLVNRTYDVDSGCVSVDGLDVRDWQLASLRRQISIIEQDIFLFSRSIAENIAFGAPGANHADIEAAARAAQAHEFIMAFKDGYETVLGERGVTLSGGQRQRLALARAFLTSPRILILDDSTSAVDSETEDKIQRAIALAAEGRTTLIITHRLSQIRWADLVLVVRAGRLVAAGSHEQLLQSSPAYQRIFRQDVPMSMESKAVPGRATSS